MKYIKLDPKEIREFTITYETNIKGIKLVRPKVGIISKILCKLGLALVAPPYVAVLDDEGKLVELEMELTGEDNNIYALSKKIPISRRLGCFYNEYVTSAKINTLEGTISPVATIMITFADDRRKSLRVHYQIETKEEKDDFSEIVDKVVQGLVKNKEIVWI